MSSQQQIEYDPIPLQLARLHAGLTYRQLAARVNVTYMAVWFALNGRTKHAPLVKELCVALGVPPKDVWKKAKR